MQPNVAQPRVPYRAGGHQLEQQEGHRGLQWRVPSLQPWLQGPWGPATAPASFQGWSFPTIPTILVGLSQCCLPALLGACLGFASKHFSSHLFTFASPLPHRKVHSLSLGEIFPLSPDLALRARNYVDSGHLKRLVKQISQTPSASQVLLNFGLWDQSSRQIPHPMRPEQSRGGRAGMFTPFRTLMTGCSAC